MWGEFRSKLWPSCRRFDLRRRLCVEKGIIRQLQQNGPMIRGMCVALLCATKSNDLIFPSSDLQNQPFTKQRAREGARSPGDRRQGRSKLWMQRAAAVTGAQSVTNYVRRRGTISYIWKVQGERLCNLSVAFPAQLRI